MNDILLEAYKTEFETTDITITELLKKYSITKRKLKGHEDWTKHQTIQLQQDFINDQQTLLLTAPATNMPTTTTCASTISKTNAEKIEAFKTAALDRALLFIEVDAQFAEVKEFKDIVAIVDSIEKSYQKVDPEAGKSTVNLFVQQIMAQFKDDV
jgi:hypothetical protein